VELPLDQLALNQTNNPHPKRFDGAPPKFEPKKIMVAGLGSITGLLTQSIIAQTGSDTVYYFINDHLGTPQKVIDENNEIVWEADYKPFGNVSVTISTFDNNFRFPGQYYDEDTGLHYNWHRYYEPGIGRYLRADPLNLGNVQIARQNEQTASIATMLYQYGLSNTQVLNYYAYCLNDPINKVDTEGLVVWGPFFRWAGKQIVKRIGKQIGKKIEEREIANPLEQQKMDKDTDGDGINDFYDTDNNDSISDKKYHDSKDTTCK